MALQQLSPIETQPQVRTVRPNRPGAALRRLADLGISLSALVLLAPVLAVIAVAIRLESRGPVIFRQARVGRHRARFTVLKFRTMQTDNNDARHRAEVLRQLGAGATPLAGAVGFKARNDPRITRVGRILRRYSLDELPQLWNVVRGDMAIIGPRPSLTWEADAFPAWAEPRFQVKPGLTGLWQVTGRNELSVHEMLQLDIRYAETQSMSRDLGILIRTVPVVLTGRGAA